MLKKYWLFLLLLFYQSSYADGLLPSSIHPVITRQPLLLDVTNVNNNFLIAVGERGYVLRSKNATDWVKIDVPVSVTLTSVFFVNNLLGWAVGHQGTILHSQDAGFTWQVQAQVEQLTYPFLDVAFKDSNNGIAIGAYGLFYQTNDGGVNWQKKLPLSLLANEQQKRLNTLKQKDEQLYLYEISHKLPHFNRLFLDGRTLFLVGEGGLIAKSNDFGNNWKRFKSIGKDYSFYDLLRTPKGNLLVIGEQGKVFRSINNGVSWQKRDVEVTNLLNSIISVDDLQIYLFANQGGLLVSNDDGYHFNRKYIPNIQSLIAATVYDDHLVVATEQGIKILLVTSLL